MRSISPRRRLTSSKQVLALQDPGNHAAPDHEVRYFYGYHRLDYRDSFRHYTGVMPASDLQSGLFHLGYVHGLLFLGDGRCWFESHPEKERHSRRHSSQYPSRIVRQCHHPSVFHGKLVIILRTFHPRRFEPCPKLDTLHSGYTKQYLGQFSIQRVKQWFSHAYGKVENCAFYNAPHAVTLGFRR